jgi:hypothetical protein
MRHSPSTAGALFGIYAWKWAAWMHLILDEAMCDPNSSVYQNTLPIWVFNRRIWASGEKNGSCVKRPFDVVALVVGQSAGSAMDQVSMPLSHQRSGLLAMQSGVHVDTCSHPHRERASLHKRIRLGSVDCLGDRFTEKPTVYADHKQSCGIVAGVDISPRLRFNSWRPPRKPR